MSAISRPSNVVTLSAAFAAALVLAGCKEEVAVAPEPIRPVKVMTVTREASERPVTYSGAVEARTTAALGFRVAGKLVERRVDVGDRVEAGTVVARLDGADLDLALRAAEAAVDSARAGRDVAADALARTRTLFEKGHVAKAALDKAVLESDQAVATYDRAVSSRDQAKNQAAYGDLLADGPGIVTEVRAEAGQVLAAGAPVVVVARDGDKEVRVAVPEQDVRHFDRGVRVRVAYWADPTVNHTGVVREIAGSADAPSRTFAVRVALPDDPRVRLGQTATVSVSVPLGEAGVAVPLSALDRSGGDTVVWTVDRASETVASRRVGLAGTTGDGVRVTAGLAPGDLVVTAGTQFLTEGKKVRLVSGTATASLGPAR